MDIINTVFETKDQAKNACVHVLTHGIDEVKDKPLLILYSGGSNIELAGEIINFMSQSRFSYECTFAAVDERFDPVHSNYLALQHHLEKEHREKKQGMVIINTSPDGRTLSEMADWYDLKLKTTIQQIKDQNGAILTLLGMGEDGHVAGILPMPHDEQRFNNLFVQTNRTVVGFHAEGLSQYTQRYTLTYPALLLSDSIFLYAAGKKKYEVIASAGIKNEKPFQLPILLLSTHQSRLKIFCSND